MFKRELLSTPQNKGRNSSNAKRSNQPPTSNYKAIIQRVMANPRSFTPADAKVLQRTIGNQAVGKLMNKIGIINARPVQGQILQGKFSTIQKEEVLNEKETLVQMKMIPTQNIIQMVDAPVIKYLLMSDSNLTEEIKNDNFKNYASFEVQDIPRIKTRLSKLKTDYKNDAILISKIDSFLGFTLEPVEQDEKQSTDSDIASEWAEKGKSAALSHKANKPTEKRSLYLGSGPKIDAKISSSPSPEKKKKREEKTLMVPDDKWTWSVNLSWLNAAIQNKAKFKLIADIPEDVKALLKNPLSSVSGENFLKRIYELYGTKGDNKGNDFWNTTARYDDNGKGAYIPEEEEAGRFTYLSEELAIMLDAYYRLLERDGKNIMVPPEDEHN